MPAQAGIQEKYALAYGYAVWIPAVAGMTPVLSTQQIHMDRLLGLTNVVIE